MQLMFLVSCLGLVGYLMFLPWAQGRALTRARVALQASHFAQAMREVDQVRQAWPQFYASQATALCGDVVLAQAQQLVHDPQPDFTAAVGQARSLAARCQTSTRDGEVVRFVEQAATRHLAHAHDRCQQHDYAGALSELQHLATLPYPEQTLTQAREDTAQCRLAWAHALIQEQRFVAALDELHHLTNADSAAVRQTALQRVPDVVQAEVQRWLQRQDYAQAFKQLAKYQQQFLAHADTTSALSDLGGQAEYQVFGRILQRPCRQPVVTTATAVQPVRYQRARKRNAPALPQRQGPVVLATTFGADVPGGVQTMNLRLHNTTPHRLQVLLRGPDSHDLLLEPQAVQDLDLSPAEYLVGVYAPEKCHIQPARGAWVMRTWAPLSVRLSAS